ncbi:FecCD family ABC transporter permease [Galactobacter caseinivorans]|uniref:FecCD family ABC transporter permease n=1 Tax=Galactobacter caseinivorans TaxID=2676123 RepID=UPI0013143B3F|nr:iron ABC transporter permease [Galactobacter caseinivorans]
MALTAAVLLVLLALAVAASLAFGARGYSFEAVWSALITPAADPDAAAVISSRIPRTVNGLLVGAALALCGAVMQAATRNPLADAGLLGLNAGSALAVVIGIGVFGVAAVGALSWFALVGAAGAALVVHAVSTRGSGGSTPLKLALAGAALAAGLVSVTQAILLQGRDELDTFRFWQVGSLSQRQLDELLVPALVLAAGVLLALICSPALDRLALGDDVAASLGSHPARVRLLSLGAAVLLAGAATTIGGPIAFVGLVIPHALRPFVGSKQTVLAPLSLLAGPLLVLAADTFGRVVAPPGEVPVGVMTALVGAPVFLILLRVGSKR